MIGELVNTSFGNGFGGVDGVWDVESVLSEGISGEVDRVESGVWTWRRTFSRLNGTRSELTNAPFIFRRVNARLCAVVNAASHSGFWIR